MNRRRLEGLRYLEPLLDLPEHGGRGLRCLAPKVRILKTAAVLILCEEGAPTYAELVGNARKNISLIDLSIVDTKIRKAQSGDSSSKFQKKIRDRRRKLLWATEII